MSEWDLTLNYVEHINMNHIYAPKKMLNIMPECYRHNIQ